MARFLMAALAIATGIVAFCAGTSGPDPRVRVSFARPAV